MESLTYKISSSFTFPLLLLIFLPIRPAFSQQSYDWTSCETSTAELPGSNYLCSGKSYPCDTFIVYRAQPNQTLSSIASLFNLDVSELNFNSNNPKPGPDFLPPGREVIIDLPCYCSGRFSETLVTYHNSNSYSLPTIACDVYQGLVKAQVLGERNRDHAGANSTGTLVQVPIRCACSGEMYHVDNDTPTYFVTYPILEADTIDIVAAKFNVSGKAIQEANGLKAFETIYPQTTINVPENDLHDLNLTEFSTPKTVPQKTIPSSPQKSHNSRSSIAEISLASTAAFIVVLLGLVLFVRRKRSSHQVYFSQPANRLSCLSPDFFADVSKLKHSLVSFSLEELNLATDNFSEGALVGASVYEGRISGLHLAIEEMRSLESAHHVVSILTSINHLNVVKLEGCCYGTKPYLVFEFAEYGSLRRCLACPAIRKQFTWEKRVQVAYDLAEGLHYIHYCTKPSFIHRNISSSNVLITGDWRAKLLGFDFAAPVFCGDGEGEVIWITESEDVLAEKGYLPPEYLGYGQASTKVDVFAYGIVLLELLSANEVITDGKCLKDSIRYLIDECGLDSSTCLEKFNGFMDPCLEEGRWPFGDAMCLAFLAKGCTEEDPRHRPTMKDVLKILSRIR